jgi:hypothetical protein
LKIRKRQLPAPVLQTHFHILILNKETKKMALHLVVNNQIYSVDLNPEKLFFGQ